MHNRFLFLDEQMRVRRFTAQVTDIFKLIPGDVGRPITDLVTSLDSPALEKTAREVLRTLVFQEEQISAQGNRWFTVRTMPNRTRDNRIDGVIITFVEVTAEKRLESTLQQDHCVHVGHHPTLCMPLLSSLSIQKQTGHPNDLTQVLLQVTFLLGQDDSFPSASTLDGTTHVLPHHLERHVPTKQHVMPSLHLLPKQQ